MSTKDRRRSHGTLGIGYVLPVRVRRRREPHENWGPITNHGYSHARIPLLFLLAINFGLDIVEYEIITSTHQPAKAV